MKTLDNYFADWETETFGYGYGTGEEHVLPALKLFMAAIGRDDRLRAYDHTKLEAAVGAPVAWLLINVLCHADIIEYGTSPRYGWLTKEGEALKAYIDSKTVEELYEATSRDQEYVHCYPTYCNCDEGEKCSNPFWVKR